MASNLNVPNPGFQQSLPAQPSLMQTGAVSGYGTGPNAGVVTQQQQPLQQPLQQQAGMGVNQGALQQQKDAFAYLVNDHNRFRELFTQW
jgi:hypothetical protein